MPQWSQKYDLANNPDQKNILKRELYSLMQFQYRWFAFLKNSHEFVWHHTNEAKSISWFKWEYFYIWQANILAFLYAEVIIGIYMLLQSLMVFYFGISTSVEIMKDLNFEPLSLMFTKWNWDLMYPQLSWEIWNENNALSTAEAYLLCWILFRIWNILNWNLKMY